MARELTSLLANTLLIYDPDTGELRWCRSPDGWVNRSRTADSGRGCRDGYKRIKIDGQLYLSHRVIWLMKTGKWPKDSIDHINRIRSDNRWSNLREADAKINARNRTMSMKNKTGYNGVRHKHVGYEVDIGDKYIGWYRDKEEAHQARLEAQAEIGGYTPDHGTRHMRENPEDLSRWEQEHDFLVRMGKRVDKAR